MAVENLKTPSITVYDTKPLVGVSTGQGSPGTLREVNDHVAASAAASIGSTYRMVRIPTNAVVKHVFLKNGLLGAGAAVDIDVAHSDSPTDGTVPALQGLIPQIAGADNKLFGAAVAVAAAQQIEVTFSGTFTTTHQNLPLWNVLTNLGTTTFSADPGGLFDILLKVTSAFVGGGDVAAVVQFVTD
jgi:hypothetical protein